MRRMRRSTWLAVGALLAACGNKLETTAADKAVAATSPSARFEKAAPTPDESRGAPSAALETWGQKLIRSAEMRVEVKDVPAKAAAIDRIALQRGGFLADSKVAGDDEVGRTAHLVLRVPSDQFGGAMDALRGIGVVKFETSATSDVTKQYADIETRLAVTEQTAGRLRAILADRTAKLGDILEVEREIARVVAEIEDLKGQRRYYDRQIAMSTISVDIFDVVPTKGTPILRPVGLALHESVEVLARSLAALVYFLTFIMPWAAIVTLVWWIRNKTRFRAAAPGAKTA